MTITHKHSRRLTTRREEVRRQNPVSGTNETQSPSTHRRPEKTQTKEGDRPPDQTRPPDPQRRPTDPPESALTSNCRSMSELEVDGAAEFGAPRRLRRRPRRQPAVSAAARACSLLEGRPRAPCWAPVAASAAATAQLNIHERHSDIGENTFSFLCRLAERTLIILVPTLRGCGSTHTRTPQHPLHPKHPAGAAVVGDSLVVVGVPLTRMRPCFALARNKNPFAEMNKNKLPWSKIEGKGMEDLLAHCLAHSNLPPQVWSRA